MFSPWCRVELVYMQILSKILNAEIDVTVSHQLFYKSATYVNHYILLVKTVHFKSFALPK
jgi:hypothetical protein